MTYRASMVQVTVMVSQSLPLLDAHYLLLRAHVNYRTVTMTYFQQVPCIN